MNADPSVAIEVKGLAKRFEDLQAVERVDFSVFSGELFGFLGPNGAGKTTTINMMTGLARPDSGTIRINGIDCVKHPRSAQYLIGVVPDESNLYPELTGFENLCFCAALYGIRKAERLCHRIAFILSGRIVRVDTVENLIQPIREKHVIQIACTTNVSDIQEIMAEHFPDLTFSVPAQGLIRVEGDDPIRVGPLVRILEDQGAEVSEARKIKPSLEDIFVRITGIEAGVMRGEKEKMGGKQ